ncbi:MAG TPA: penicillin-insensitive murein endopeptidase [Polyangiales bacterium]|nr:penicillin-insensitive murein endopeptidase [Polyangiales bacterium]
MTRPRWFVHLVLVGALALAWSCTKKPPPAQSSRTLAPGSANQAVQTETPEPLDWSQFDSTSLRNPSDGALRGGVPLPLAAPGLRFNPKRDPKTRFGTVEVVRGLLAAGSRVDEALQGLPITINDLSYAEGGPIPHHRSHQSGRDVDVLFYQLGPDGAPIESVGAFFDPSGEGVDFRDLSNPSDDVALSLDIPRNWLFLRSLIEDEDAQLQQIYLAEHLRALLLDYARREGEPSAAVERFAEMSCQPSYPHDDHFHFRFFCAPDDIAKGCLDSPPMYPWQLQKLEASGVRPRPLAPNRAEARARIVTHEEAREAAGPMDAEVERWLDRRKNWLKRPHPGRTYCP